MSDLTPQEIRDRLDRMETLLADIAPDGTQAPLQLAVDLCVAKATVLSAAALTLLVEEQEQSNKIATAQVYATMGPSMFSQARAILDA